MSAPPSRCWVVINLGNLERNLKRIRSALPSYLKYVAVVKADAYGHGMPPTVMRLMHCGADMFAVANLAEAAEIRELGSGWPILILSAILPIEEKSIVELQVTPTISSLDEVQRFSALAVDSGRDISVHLKVDTGMGRLGVWYESAVDLYKEIKAAKGLRLEGVFTHFSSADTDPEFTAVQRERFLNCINAMPGLDASKVLVHADNSAGLDTFPEMGPFRGARVGLLQFGVLPSPNSLLSKVEVDAVLSFHSRVGLIKNLPAGTPISYGQTMSLKRDSKVAIITAGYGDGIPTALSNQGKVIVAGQKCDVLGRVTMDQTIVDITDLEAVKIGDPVTFIGEQEGEEITVSEFSKWSREIPWETFVSITKRVQRVYKTDTGV